MKAVLLAFATLLWMQSAAYEHADEVDATPQMFRFQRVLTLPLNAQAGQACAVVDAPMEEHTAGRMQALRLYQLVAGKIANEVPFALTESGEAGQPWEPARVVNAGERQGRIVFDLMMPRRTYSEVDLDLRGKDFLATAKISGFASDGKRTELGTQTLFDFQSQGLGHSTRLMLQEASFPVLHVELMLKPARKGDESTFASDMVRGAEVPPSRESQTLYTAVAEATNIAQQGHDSVAMLHVAAHVPLERAAFTLRPEFTKNFSRAVTVTDAPGDTVRGEIERVKLPPHGGDVAIDRDEESIEAMLGANLRDAADVKVSVANGDDAPLPIASVSLEMRQRKLCFDATPDAQYVLRYGSTQPVRAAVYDYARLFHADRSPTLASVGAEMADPEFDEAPSAASYSQRHPWVLWAALLAAIATLGWVALGSARRV